MICIGGWEGRRWEDADPQRAINSIWRHFWLSPLRARERYCHLSGRSHKWQNVLKHMGDPNSQQCQNGDSVPQHYQPWHLSVVEVRVQISTWSGVVFICSGWVTKTVSVYSPTVLGAGSRYRGARGAGFGEDCLPCGCLLAVPSHDGERGSKLLASLLTQGPILVTSAKPNHFPKTATLNAIAQSLEFQHVNFGVGIYYSVCSSN